jgi:hypothetical protein
MHSSSDPFSAPMKNAMVQRVQRRVLAAAMIAACFAVGVQAQDALPETPPELKDFRLDTPKPKEKAPEPAPTVQPAPQPASKATQQPPTRTQPRPNANSAPQPRQQASPDVMEASPADTAIAQPVVPEATNEPSAEPAAEPAPTVATESPATSGLLGYWPFLLGFVALLGGYFAFRRWKAAQLVVREPIIIPSEPEFAPVPPKPEPAPPIRAQPQAKLSASFEPAEARLSVANLTVTGCLRMRYEGAEALPSLRLRNMVISACEGQRAMIEAFHNDVSSGQIDMLDGIQPGEEIVLTLELQVPRDALQAFDWRERRFVAPILLLNVGSDDSTVAPCRINCLVGQRGSDASAKMQPLPVDRGPKLFEALRFQPIAA